MISNSNALSVLTNLRNMFQGLQYAEEIITLITGAENLAKESEKKMIEYREAYEREALGDKGAKARLTLDIEELTVQRGGAAADLAEMRATMAAEHATLTSEIADLTSARDALAAAIAELRLKVASV